jgi:hypothetical protein
MARQHGITTISARTIAVVTFVLHQCHAFIPLRCPFSQQACHNVHSCSGMIPEQVWRFRSQILPASAPVLLPLSVPSSFHYVILPTWTALASSSDADAAVEVDKRKCFEGVVIAITGNFDGKREEVLDSITRNGATFSGTVHKNVKYLVCDQAAIDSQTKHVSFIYPKCFHDALFQRWCGASRR